MTVKEYLNRVRDLDAEIQRDELERETWLSIATSLSAPADGGTHGGSRNIRAPFERCLENADELERRIKAGRETLSEMRVALAGEIQTLEDRDEVIVLLMRYVALMRWEDITGRMGLSESPVMKKHSRALAHFEEAFPDRFEKDS